MRNYLVQLLLFGSLIWGLNSCFGPDPVVLRSTLQPPESPGQPHLLIVTLQNRGGGEGGIEVIARVQVKATGATVAQANDNIDLKAHETLTATLEVDPSSSGPYDISVEVRYPPN